MPEDQGATTAYINLTAIYWNGRGVMRMWRKLWSRCFGFLVEWRMSVFRAFVLCNLAVLRNPMEQEFMVATAV